MARAHKPYLRIAPYAAMGVPMTQDDCRRALTPRLPADMDDVISTYISTILSETLAGGASVQDAIAGLLLDYDGWISFQIVCLIRIVGFHPLFSLL